MRLLWTFPVLLLASHAACDTVAFVKSLADGSSFVNVSGVVTSVGGNTGRLQFTLQDATGAVTVDKGTITYTQPQVASKVTIASGIKTTFSGLIELQPSSAASISVQATNQTLPGSQVFTSVAAFRSASLNATQALRVRLRNVYLTGALPSGAGSTTWLSSTASGGQTFTVTDNNTDLLTVRLTSDLGTKLTNWRGKTRPTLSTTDKFDLEAVAGIFNSALCINLNDPVGTSAKTDTSGPILSPTAGQTTSPASSYDPLNGKFGKESSNHVRVVAWNTEKNLMSTDTTMMGRYARILATLNPDIISFEEVVPSFSFTDIQSRLNTFLPLSGGASWNLQLGISDGFNRNVVASRWTMSMRITNTTPVSDERGVTGALIDLPNTTYTKDLYTMGVHFKCCTGASNTAARQQHSDALAKWFGDLRSAGGAVDLPTSTPALVMGDFNLVDSDPQQPDVTLRTGDIQNNATYGADIKGDWDATDLKDLTPANPINGNLNTWPSTDSSPTSRIDRIYFTDSVATAVHGFVLNTQSMTPAQLNGAGLQSTDTSGASDHCPIVADLSFPFLVPQSGVADWSCY